MWSLLDYPLSISEGLWWLSRLQTRHEQNHCSFQDEYNQGKEQ